MRVHKSSVLITMLFLFIIALLHLSSYKHISRGGKEEIEERTRTKFHFSFPHAAEIKDNKSLNSKNNNFKEIHTVSHRLVPYGPNPLHH
ncbi:unnamed protein product [Lupinus luteus]|uniref:Uncharacterized protein n=1 Tax=Lupinus luteus TaxID=3873 RepID=A0AAV1W324_LUPLU